jgi:hypothetical protein
LNQHNKMCSLKINYLLVIVEQYKDDAFVNFRRKRKNKDILKQRKVLCFMPEIRTMI